MNLLLQKITRSAIWVALLLLIIILSILEPNYFLSTENWTNVARQISVIALLSAGQFLVILTAGIDLSVGSVMALSMVLFALAIHSGLPVAICFLVPIFVGLACGLANGLGLIWLRLPHPFIMTLAMLNIARGATYLVTGGIPISGIPDNLRWVGSADFEITLQQGQLFVPYSIIIVIGVYILLAFMLNYCAIGKHIYAVGGNRKGALYAGIKVNGVLLKVYTLCGILAGAAGLILAGRTNSGYPNAGIGYELDSIAAVVIGGTSFFGGRGKISSTFGGVLLIGFFRNGLNLLDVSVFWQQVLVGLMILLATTPDLLRHRENTK